MARRLAPDDRRIVLDHAAQICIERGRTLTLERRRVLDWMIREGRPMGAYEILNALAIKSPPTIYRILNFLQEQGFVCRIESLNSYVSSRDLGNRDPSQFVICVVCGVVKKTADTKIGGLLQDTEKILASESSDRSSSFKVSAKRALGLAMGIRHNDPPKTPS